MAPRRRAGAPSRPPDWGGPTRGVVRPLREPWRPHLRRSPAALPASAESARERRRRRARPRQRCT
ncbi:MAG: hypothetical protein BRD37_05065 [Bacteroidetes bacterium QH_8_67_23]|nr:MAG: hypothetical protein BRD37_05065 [Bacteroidetes bacterium QH_8_67_23]